MATDIWIHIEYKSRHKNKFVYDREVDGERVYILFGALAGTRGSCEPVYSPRGLPNDVTSHTLRIYNEFGKDAHTPSWLTTEEQRDCIDQAIKVFSKEYSLKEVNSWLSPYEKIFEYMKNKEDKGDLCRIVFWFDN